MSFAHPQLLWLLAILPPAVAVFFWRMWGERRKLAARFIEERLLPGLLVGVSPARQKIRLSCLVFAVAMLIVTLAGPRWGFDWEEVKQRGLDIVVAIDASKSMLAEDIAPNRLARAKLAGLDLMQLAKSDRLGLVAFAGQAFLACPLTIDDTAFRQSVESLDVNTISEGGTAIAEAINVAMTAFKERDNYKALVLFTDGEDNAEGALEAAQNAAKMGLRIFTVGIGTTEGELLRIKDARGNTDYVRDEQGNVVKSHLNETLLQQIASATEGGFYAPLRGGRTIETLYERGLAPLPKSEGKEKLVRRLRDRYQWPLAAAILALLIEILLPEGKRQPRATRKAPSAKQGALRGAAAILVAIGVCGTAWSSPSSALRQYKEAQFGAAQKEYERLAEEDKSGDDRLRFNAGTAAYRGTNYEEAIRLFSSALNARDLRLQEAAYFNLGNAQFRLGQTAKDLDEMQKDWESAVKSYQSAATLDKADADAAYNLDFAKQCVEQIRQLREAARLAKDSADQEVRRRSYHRALEIMQSLTGKNPLAKQFEEYTKKLQDIDAIANPSQP